jgi:toxin ParE1/3/4
MAEIVWTEPALNDLDAIADYIALDKPAAAGELVQRIFSHIEQLTTYPDSGSMPAELPGSRYRQIVESPCRVIYRHDGKAIYILYVVRGERHLRKAVLKKRDAPRTSRAPTTSTEEATAPGRTESKAHICMPRAFL